MGKRSVLRIGQELHELRQDEDTQLWLWEPVIGGMPLGGLFVSEAVAMDFGHERVRTLGQEMAALVEREPDASTECSYCGETGSPCACEPERYEER